MNADRVFLLLLKGLEESNTELTQRLSTNLKEEIVKRRSGLSTVLSLLDDYRYEFELESKLGVEKPSESEVLEILTDLIGASESASLSESDEDAETPVGLQVDIQVKLRIIRCLIRVVFPCVLPPSSWR